MLLFCSVLSSCWFLMCIFVGLLMLCYLMVVVWVFRLLNRFSVIILWFVCVVVLVIRCVERLVMVMCISWWFLWFVW